MTAARTYIKISINIKSNIINRFSNNSNNNQQQNMLRFSSYCSDTLFFIALLFINDRLLQQDPDGKVSILQSSSPNSMRLNDRVWIGASFSFPTFPRTPRSPVKMLFSRQKRRRVRMKLRTCEYINKLVSFK